MTNQDDLRVELWEAVLETLDKCQEAINLMEALDGGTNQYIGEWEELDEAYAHLHNVKRWLGRAWRMGQENKGA